MKRLGALRPRGDGPKLTVGTLTGIVVHPPARRWTWRGLFFCTRNGALLRLRGVRPLARPKARFMRLLFTIGALCKKCAMSISGRVGTFEARTDGDQAAKCKE